MALITILFYEFLENQKKNRFRQRSDLVLKLHQFKFNIIRVILNSFR